MFCETSGVFPRAGNIRAISDRSLEMADSQDYFVYLQLQKEIKINNNNKTIQKT